MKFKNFLWIMLIICIIAAVPSVLIRITNEYKNTKVIPVIDYNSFHESAEKAYIEIDTILDKFMDAGVKNIAIEEINVQTLYEQGLLEWNTVGRFLSSNTYMDKEHIKQINNSIMKIGANNYSLIMKTNDANTIKQIEKALDLRFDKSKYTSLTINNENIFIISKEIQQFNELSFGFDESIIKKLKDKGFDIVLKPINANSFKDDYLLEYDRLIKDYNVNIIIVIGSTFPGYPSQVETISNIIKSNDLRIGSVEKESQVGMLDIKGMNKVVKQTNYPVNRVFSAPSYILNSANSDEIFYNWLHAIVERNNRIIYLRPLANTELSYDERIYGVIDASEKLIDFISSKGYDINGELPRFNTEEPTLLSHFVIGCSLIIGSILFLLYLFSSNKLKLFCKILGISAVLILILFVFILKMDLRKIYAFGAAVLYPSLSSLLLIRYLKQVKNEKNLLFIIKSFGIIFGINVLGIIIIVSSLSDINYTMNFEMFRGVKLAFILPLIFFVISFNVLYNNNLSLIKKIKTILEKKLTYKDMIILMFILIAVFILIARSGNDIQIPVLNFELILRKLLDKVMFVRPRFKEWIIGYPCLITMLYLYKRYKDDRILLWGGLGVTVGSISMLNSFCHGFSNINVSVVRTFNGLLLGSILGIFVVIVIRYIINFYENHLTKL